MKIAIATPVLFERSSPYNHLFRDILSSFLAAGHTVTRLVAVRDEGETDYTFGLDQIACQTYRRRESAQKNNQSIQICAYTHRKNALILKR